MPPGLQKVTSGRGSVASRTSMKFFLWKSVIAAARSDNELILYLVKKGADVTFVGRNGQTYRGYGKWTIPADLSISRNS